MSLLPKNQKDVAPFLWKSLRNRYVRVTLLFLLWVIFIDHSRLISQEYLERDIVKLKEEKETYLKMIGEVKMEKEDIQRNREKYAREHYYMKRADEDVYIVEE